LRAEVEEGQYIVAKPSTSLHQPHRYRVTPDSGVEITDVKGIEQG